MRYPALAILLALSFVFPARAEPQRLALVIGNGAYERVPSLQNPPRDAAEIGKMLEAVGFHVRLLLNGSLTEMSDAVGQLGAQAASEDVVVVYYAGHASEINGANYLLPVDVEATRARLRNSALSFNQVTAALQGRASTTLIFLDSCRDNPFSLQVMGEGVRRRSGTAAPSRSVAGATGLAPVTSSNGMLIAFATAPGDVAFDGSGDHSPFTTALLRHLPDRGVEVRQMLGRVRQEVRTSTGGQQIPWDNSSLETDFYFNNSDRLPRIYPNDGRWQAKNDTWSISAVVQGTLITGRIEGCFNTNGNRKWSFLGPAFQGTISPAGEIYAETVSTGAWLKRSIAGTLSNLEIRVLDTSKRPDCTDTTLALQRQN